MQSGDVPDVEQSRNWHRVVLMDEPTRRLEQQFDLEQGEHASFRLQAKSSAEESFMQTAVLERQFGALEREFSSVQNEATGVDLEFQLSQAEFQDSLAALRQTVALKSDVVGLKNELGSALREFQTFRNVVERDQTGCKGEMDRLDHTRGEIQGELQRINQQVRSAKEEVQSTKRGENEHRRIIQEQQQQIERIGKDQQIQQEAAELKVGFDGIADEMQGLHKRLNDLGVLAPKREAPTAEEEEETPPVGTIELGEDCFSARLLIRLGYLKARGWREEGSFGEEETDPLSPRADDDNVTGIVEPEISQDGQGYFQVTTLWLGICMVTMFLQLLVIVVMLSHGSGAGDCLEKPLTLDAWLFLHGSKACAMCVVGMLLAKDLMDTINYWMISQLLETEQNLEVVISAGVRGMLTVLVAAANVILYRNETSPANVWINMTALGFINELSQYVVTVAKNGVFGHPISKTLTTLNFQLTFVSEYPAWFTYVRNATLTICFGAIALLSIAALLLPDAQC